MKKYAAVLASLALLHSTPTLAQSCPSVCVNNGAVVGNYTPGPSLTGAGNVFVGGYAGANTTWGANNAFIGNEAGYLNQTGNNNTFVGREAGRNNTFGSDNVFLGISAGVGNTTGNNNTIIGPSAGASNTTGSHNVYIGRNAGRGNLAGNYNLFLGYDAGNNNQGDKNVFLGHQAGAFETGSRILHIADNPFNSLLKGDFANHWLNVSNKLGIGVNNPTEALEVSGNGIANQWLTYSDERLKDDIKIIDGAMATLSMMDGLSYRLNAENSGSEQLRSYGVSAQRIKAVAPDLVRADKDGFLSVNYNGLIPLLIEALKEKDREIKVIQAQIKSIQHSLPAGI